MARFFMVFLALVLPLQLGWAAAHGYVHDAMPHHEAVAMVDAAHADDVAVTVAVAAAGSHALETSDAPRHGGAPTADHGCCNASHSCHGTPLLLPCIQSGVRTDNAASLVPATQAFAAREPFSRHERPQWAPA